LHLHYLEVTLLLFAVPTQAEHAKVVADPEQAVHGVLHTHVAAPVAATVLRV